jgi:L-ascorbate metabolism protein UlaG (beta-lactamase superfamily)
VLPEYEPDRPIYVFSSHKHPDHFDMDILKMADRYADIHYILSKDCKMSPHFLEKHGYSSDISKKITYVSPVEKYNVAGITVETLRSTDMGVAFCVDADGTVIYHAGDLNDWYWDGAGDLVNGDMTRKYRREIKRLSSKKINVAFVPLDPRQGQFGTRGMQFFLENVDADYVFPMHMWQDYSGIASYKKRISNAAMADRIVDIERENQSFDIRVD